METRAAHVWLGGSSSTMAHAAVRSASIRCNHRWDYVYLCCVRTKRNMRSPFGDDRKEPTKLEYLATLHDKGPQQGRSLSLDGQKEEAKLPVIW